MGLLFDKMHGVVLVGNHRLNRGHPLEMGTSGKDVVSVNSRKFDDPYIEIIDCIGTIVGIHTFDVSTTTIIIYKLTHDPAVKFSVTPKHLTEKQLMQMAGVFCEEVDDAKIILEMMRFV